MTPENDTTYSRLPECYREEMKRYIEDHAKPGPFLRGMLKKDMHMALTKVDTDMIGRLRDIYLWIYTEVPSICWGNEEKVRNWLNKKGE